MLQSCPDFNKRVDDYVYANLKPDYKYKNVDKIFESAKYYALKTNSQEVLNIINNDALLSRAYKEMVALNYLNQWFKATVEKRKKR